MTATLLRFIQSVAAAGLATVVLLGLFVAFCVWVVCERVAAFSAGKFTRPERAEKAPNAAERIEDSDARMTFGDEYIPPPLPPPNTPVEAIAAPRPPVAKAADVHIVPTARAYHALGLPVPAARTAREEANDF